MKVQVVKSLSNRALAKCLRGGFDTVTHGRYTYLNGTLFGLQLSSSSEEGLRNGMRRIAHAIEGAALDEDELAGIADEMQRAATLAGCAEETARELTGWAERIRAVLESGRER